MCVVPEEQGCGADRFQGALRSCMREGDAEDKEIHQYYSCCSSREDERGVRPAGGVVFTCNGRGFDFHKETNAEGRGLEAALPGCPFIGIFAGGEYGPFGRSHDPAMIMRPNALPRFIMHSYSCSVAMFG